MLVLFNTLTIEISLIDTRQIFFFILFFSNFWIFNNVLILKLIILKLLLIYILNIWICLLIIIYFYVAFSLIFYQIFNISLFLRRQTVCFWMIRAIFWDPFWRWYFYYIIVDTRIDLIIVQFFWISITFLKITMILIIFKHLLIWSILIGFDKSVTNLVMLIWSRPVWIRLSNPY